MWKKVQYSLNVFVILLSFNFLEFNLAQAEMLPAVAEIDKLQAAYENSQILILANSSHETQATYSYLKALLDRVSTDQRLKFIVLERTSDSDEILRKTSVQDFSELLPNQPISDPILRALICEEKNGKPIGFGEWAYTFSHFMPYLNQKNQKRPNPVLVRSIDGVSFDDLDPSYPAVSEGNCSKDAIWPVYIASRNREYETYNNFLKRIYANLSPNDKVIIVYHYWHVTNGLSGCMGEKSSSGEWTSQLGIANWFTYLSLSHPEIAAKAKVVVLDESGAQNPEGVLKVSTNGKIEFAPGSFIRQYLGGRFNQDHLDLNQIIYASIQIQESEKIPYLAPSKQLPIQCAPIR